MAGFFFQLKNDANANAISVMNWMPTTTTVPLKPTHHQTDAKADAQSVMMWMPHNRHHAIETDADLPTHHTADRATMTATTVPHNHHTADNLTNYHTDARANTVMPTTNTAMPTAKVSEQTVTYLPHLPHRRLC